MSTVLIHFACGGYIKLCFMLVSDKPQSFFTGWHHLVSYCRLHLPIIFPVWLVGNYCQLINGLYDYINQWSSKISLVKFQKHLHDMSKWYPLDGFPQPLLTSTRGSWTCAVRVALDPIHTSRCGSRGVKSGHLDISTLTWENAHVLSEDLLFPRDL